MPSGEFPVREVRMNDGVVFAFPRSSEAALSYIKTHADEWFIDIDRIALMGRSAGARLASLYAYRSTTVPVRAVVNYYGPNDLLRGYYDPPFPDPLNVRAILRAFLGGTPDQLRELYFTFKLLPSIMLDPTFPLLYWFMQVATI